MVGLVERRSCLSAGRTSDAHPMPTNCPHFWMRSRSPRPPGPVTGSRSWHISEIQKRIALSDRPFERNEVPAGRGSLVLGSSFFIDARCQNGGSSPEALHLQNKAGAKKRTPEERGWVGTITLLTGTSKVPFGSRQLASVKVSAKDNKTCLRFPAGHTPSQLLCVGKGCGRAAHPAARRCAQ